MLYPYQSQAVATSENTVALTAYVQPVVNAIKAGAVIPYGDYGGSTVYYFNITSNGLGNIIYTVFDKTTNLGLASFTVRFGAGTTIKQVLFDQMPRSSIQLQHLVLPKLPLAPDVLVGTVIP